MDLMKLETTLLSFIFLYLRSLISIGLGFIYLGLKVLLLLLKVAIQVVQWGSHWDIRVSSGGLYHFDISVHSGVGRLVSGY
jgi:hypothetical protein